MAASNGDSLARDGGLWIAKRRHVASALARLLAVVSTMSAGCAAPHDPALDGPEASEELIVFMSEGELDRIVNGTADIGAYEYQPQGAMEGGFLFFGAERPGFASIFGSGPNSVTLHYNANRRQMQDGELIVMDVGAKYRYYCADVTRTVPVNGRFTPRQRQVYETVLAAQRAALC